MLARLSLLVLCLSMASACDSPTALRPDAGQMETGPVTYYEHLRPILVENCTMCHTDGGIAPFTLETYGQSVEVALRMEEVTRDRIMPPFLADSSGECNEWANHRGLTDDEIALVSNWVNTGMQEGDPTIEAPIGPEAPALGSVDIVIEMPEVYDLMTELDDDYRCFIHDPEIPANTFVTGYDVHPGNAARVHHVIVYNPQDEDAEAEAYALDAEDGVMGDGYPCFGGPRVNAPPLVLWAPGGGATTFPRNTGIELEAGRAQIIQVHYNNLVESESPTTDRTTIDLSTRDGVAPAYFFPFADWSLNIPPQMESYTETRMQSLSFLPTNVRIWGVMPHMHTLGRQLRVDLLAGGTNRACMLDIPRWDFNWQLAYWLTEPIRVSPTDSAEISCTYNSMERDEITRWGDGTMDEMCLAFVYITI